MRRDQRRQRHTILRAGTATMNAAMLSPVLMRRFSRPAKATLNELPPQPAPFYIIPESVPRNATASNCRNVTANARRRLLCAASLRLSIISRRFRCTLACARYLMIRAAGATRSSARHALECRDFRGTPGSVLALAAMDGDCVDGQRLLSISLTRRAGRPLSSHQ